MTLNDPVTEVLLVGNKDALVAPTGLVQLATLSLEVREGGGGYRRRLTRSYAD